MLGLPLILQLVLQALDIGTPQPISSSHCAWHRIFSSALPPSWLRVRAVLQGRSYLARRGPILQLNVLFLFQYGLVNPNTGGVRYPLFAFVSGSLALAAWQWRRVGGSRTG